MRASVREMPSRVGGASKNLAERHIKDLRIFRSCPTEWHAKFRAGQLIVRDLVAG
jgi:hypothetical protein